MIWHPASELNPCPLQLTGSHQGPYVFFNVSNDYELRQGKDTGWGVLVCSNSSGFSAIYEGGLHEKNAVGQGELRIKAKHFSYFGGWLENMASGWGKWSDSWTEYFPEGPMAPMKEPKEPRTMKYEGGFKDGYFHGYGELIWNDGAYYEGSWKEGRRHGRGVYVTGDGKDGYFWEPEAYDHHDHHDHDVHHDHHDVHHDIHHDIHHDVHHDVHHDIHHDIHHEDHCYEHHHDFDECHNHCHNHDSCRCHCHHHESMIPVCVLEAEEKRTKAAEKGKADAEKAKAESAITAATKYEKEHQKYMTEHQKYEAEKQKYDMDHQNLQQRLHDQEIKAVKIETESEYLKKEIEDMKYITQCAIV